MIRAIQSWAKAISLALFVIFGTVLLVVVAYASMWISLFLVVLAFIYVVKTVIHEEGS